MKSWLPALIAAQVIGACKPLPATGASVASDDGTLPRVLVAVSSTPSQKSPDAFTIYAVSRLGDPELSMVRFCFGSTAACAQDTTLPSLNGLKQTVNGRSVFTSEKFVKLKANLPVTVLARDTNGADVLFGATIVTKGSVPHTVTPGGQGVLPPPSNTTVPTANNTTPPTTPPSSNAQTGTDDGSRGIAKLNELRAALSLPAVTHDPAISGRCMAWAQQMAGSVGLQHDQTVYGTPERENIIGAAGFTMTIESAFDGWDKSTPHANSMYDRAGFPTGATAGYAQYNGFACLRICPATGCT